MPGFISWRPFLSPMFLALRSFALKTVRNFYAFSGLRVGMPQTG